MGVLNLQREIGFYNSVCAESPKERLPFTTVGVLNLPREIGFYNSGCAESPKGDWLLQQWAC